MKVYKYRGNFVRDLASLENDEFFAPTKDQLNDPCEGLVSTDILIVQIEKMVEKFPHISNKMDNFKKNLKASLSHIYTSGVYSLSKSHLDELLWAHYANSHKGFCIEYELDTLLKFNKETVFKTDELFYFDVEYKFDPYAFTTRDMDDLGDRTDFMKKMLGIKSKKWDYEDEFRIISIQSGIIKYDYRAVKSIYFGLKMEEEQKDEIMRKLQGRGIKYYQIELKNNSYEFFDKSVEDLYKTDKKYLYSIAPILPCAITNIENLEYEPYFYKVAEIVRREPYCNSVLFVTIDKENSKDKALVFIVSFFEKLPPAPVLKQSYSMEEIDKLYAEIDDLDIENISKYQGN
ncbi:MAG: DUF2971 domain-containing protein [Sulfurimonas sp.]|jgi:hypothetical protein